MFTEPFPAAGRVPALSCAVYLTSFEKGMVQSMAAGAQSVRHLFFHVASEDIAALCLWAAAGWESGEDTPSVVHGSQQTAGFYGCSVVLSLQAVLWAPVFLEPHLRWV